MIIGFFLRSTIDNEILQIHLTENVQDRCAEKQNNNNNKSEIKGAHLSGTLYHVPESADSILLQMAVLKLIQVLNATPIQILAALHFPGGLVVKNLPANARDTGSTCDLGRSHMPRGS